MRDRELAQAGEPFTDQEVHALAFGTPDQWAGVIHRERWRAQGAVVMDVWSARVRADREFFETQVSGSEDGAEAPAAAGAVASGLLRQARGQMIGAVGEMSARVLAFGARASKHSLDGVAVRDTCLGLVGRAPHGGSSR